MFTRGIRPFLCIFLMAGCGKADLAGSNRSANGSPQPTGTSAPPVASPLEEAGSANNPNNQGDTNNTDPSACVMKMYDNSAATTDKETTTEHTSKIEKKSKIRKETESENGEIEEKSREKSKEEYKVKKESESDEDHNHDDDDEDDDKASNCEKVSDESKS